MKILAHSAHRLIKLTVIVLIVAGVPVISSIGMATPASAVPVPLTCAQGGECALGEIGPGGGIVFLTPNSVGNSTGRYFEATQSDLSTSLLSRNAGTTTVNGLTGIGNGKPNTLLMQADPNLMNPADPNYSGDVVYILQNYRGGGKADWYLPNFEEMQAVASEMTLTAGNYWTSQTSPYEGAYDAVMFNPAFPESRVTTSTWGGQYAFFAVRDFLPLTCAEGGQCALGEIGPGGGIVFLTPNSVGNSTGRYFEATQSGLSPSVLSSTAGTTTVNGLTGIGNGKPNTLLMQADPNLMNPADPNYSGDVVYILQNYRGGGKADWYLPNFEEMQAISAQISVAPGNHWTSQTSPYEGAYDAVLFDSSNPNSYSSTSTWGGQYAFFAVRDFLPLSVPAFTLSGDSETVTVASAATGFTSISSGGEIESYEITPAAPSGMIFDTSTGTLSGTPTQVLESTVFTITATNTIASADETFTLTVLPAIVTIANIEIPVPVAGGTPVRTLASNGQYSAAISWSPAVSTIFDGNESYTATVSLIADSNYTLTGVAPGFFTINGSATNSGNSVDAGEFTFEFPATAALTCATGGYCILGDVGPGGGIVFYVSRSAFTETGTACASSCTTLEAAPITGNYAWAHLGSEWGADFTVAGASGRAIGTGYTNTQAMFAADGDTPRLAALAFAYRGPNNLSDWFIPSMYELEQLSYLYYPIGLVGPYWSSSEIDDQWSVATSMDSETAIFLDRYSSNQKVSGYQTHAIRAFSSPLAPLTCAQGGVCVLGETGPGGGIVFLTPDSVGNSTGRYFEATQSGLGTSVLCRASGTTPVNGAAGIGNGKANTLLLRGDPNCMSPEIGSNISADVAKILQNYRGGGKSDWYLPNFEEMQAVASEMTLTAGNYWTSQTSPYEGAYDAVMFNPAYPESIGTTSTWGGLYAFFAVRDFGLLTEPAFTLSRDSETATFASAATGFTSISSGGDIASYEITPALPSGMIFDTSTGTLSGTPAQILESTVFTITATNIIASATQSFTLTVLPAIIRTANVVITAPVTSAIPESSISSNGQYTTAISWSPAVTTAFASNESYTATVTLTAEAGYTLTGVAAGFFRVNGNVPTTANSINAGVFSFEFPATVNPPTGPTLNTINLEQVGTVGTAFTLQLSATGGTAPYRFYEQIDQVSNLPAGLTLDSVTGLVSGTPTMVETKTRVTLEVHDSNNFVNRIAGVSFVISAATVPGGGNTGGGGSGGGGDIGGSGTPANTPVPVVETTTVPSKETVTAITGTNGGGSALVTLYLQVVNSTDSSTINTKPTCVEIYSRTTSPQLLGKKCADEFGKIDYQIGEGKISIRVFELDKNTVYNEYFGEVVGASFKVENATLFAGTSRYAVSLLVEKIATVITTPTPTLISAGASATEKKSNYFTTTKATKGLLKYSLKNKTASFKQDVRKLLQVLIPNVGKIATKVTVTITTPEKKSFVIVKATPVAANVSYKLPNIKFLRQGKLKLEVKYGSTTRSILLNVR